MQKLTQPDNETLKDQTSKSFFQGVHNAGTFYKLRTLQNWAWLMLREGSLALYNAIMFVWVLISMQEFFFLSFLFPVAFEVFAKKVKMHEKRGGFLRPPSSFQWRKINDWWTDIGKWLMEQGWLFRLSQTIGGWCRLATLKFWISR